MIFWYFLVELYKWWTFVRGNRRCRISFPFYMRKTFLFALEIHKGLLFRKRYIYCSFLITVMMRFHGFSSVSLLKGFHVKKKYLSSNTKISLSWPDSVPWASWCPGTDPGWCPPLPATQGSCINPFLFIKNKRIFISSEGFSTLEKNALRAMLPIQLGMTALCWQ